MASTTEKHHILSKILLGLLLLELSSLSFTVAQVGVCYGRLGNNLPSAPEVVALYNQNNIRRMRLYDPDQPTLQALRGTNIEVMLGIPNEILQNLAASQANANNWVQNNVRNYGNVRFRYISVGNEISPLRDTAQYVQYVLPAMQNVRNAINSAGLGNQIRISTAFDTGLLGSSYPPADGAFRNDVVGYVRPIVQFLASTGAPLLFNIYPYFSYIGNPSQISLDYALGRGDGVVVPGGVRYQNLFYAMLDAAYAAVERVGGQNVEIVVSESGWPSAGGTATTVDNARTYNTNLVQRIRSGTPRRPNRAIETYLFAMFDENQKNPEYERHWGLFFPNRQSKYQISFN